MSRHLAQLILVAPFLCGVAHSQIDRVSEVFVKLAQELATIRSESGSETVSSEPINVESLLGQSREDVIAGIGAPDSCNREVSQECLSDSTWVYGFYYFPPGWRGGGPDLWLHFDRDGAVDQAQWKFSR